MERHPATNETVIRALGELHLRTKLEKLTQQVQAGARYQAAAHSLPRDHQPQGGRPLPPQETDRRRRPVRRGVPENRALPRGSGYEFVDQVKGGVIPTVFIPGGRKGVRMALDSGVIAGYPVEDLRVIVYDGKSHAVDSKEIAFVSAGRKAVIDAFSKAGPIMLGP